MICKSKRNCSRTDKKIICPGNVILTMQFHITVNACVDVPLRPDAAKAAFNEIRDADLKDILRGKPSVFENVDFDVERGCDH